MPRGKKSCARLYQAGRQVRSLQEYAYVQSADSKSTTGPAEPVLIHVWSAFVGTGEV